MRSEPNPPPVPGRRLGSGEAPSRKCHDRYREPCFPAVVYSPVTFTRAPVTAPVVVNVTVPPDAADLVTAPSLTLIDLIVRKGVASVSPEVAILMVYIDSR